MERPLLIATGAVGVAWLAISASTLFPALKPKAATSKRLTRAQVSDLVRQIDITRFGGWFSNAPRRHSDVVAVIKIESNYETGAIGDNGKAHGLGQMHAAAAGDMGFTLQDLHDPYNAVLAAMKYLKWIWDTLTNWLRKTPSLTQWIGSYNAGVGNVSGRNGGVFIPLSYVNRWKSAAGR